jgi:hypothetical protein
MNYKSYKSWIVTKARFFEVCHSSNISPSRETRHTSGFVFGRPITLLSFCHCPRFFRSSMRSKRFSTLRRAAMVLAPFKLRCCDIILFSSEMSRHIKPAAGFFNFRWPVPRVPMHL